MLDLRAEQAQRLEIKEQERPSAHKLGPKVRLTLTLTLTPTLTLTLTHTPTLTLTLTLPR